MSTIFGCLVLGIPTVLRYKKTGILTEKASIVPYVVSPIFLSILIIPLSIIIIKSLNESYFTIYYAALVVSFFWTIVSSLKPENIRKFSEDFWNVNAKYIKDKEEALGNIANEQARRNNLR
jgi:hypothetical protein